MSSKRYPEGFKIEVVKQIYTYRSSKKFFWKRVSPTRLHEGVKPSRTGKTRLLSNIDNRGEQYKSDRKIRAVCYPGYGILGYRPQSGICASLHTQTTFLVAGHITAIIILYKALT